MNLREIDALVAEKVMGWSRVGKDYHTKPLHKPSKDYPGTIIDIWDDKGPHDYLIPPNSEGTFDRVSFCGCEGDAELPAYSSDISDAWEVVEKLNKLVGYKYQVDLTAKLNQGAVASRTYYYCKFSNGSGAHQSGPQQSAPLAICLAALKSVGVEV